MKLTHENAQAWSEDAATLALLHDHEPTAEVLAELKAIGFPDNLGMLPRDDKGRAVFEVMRDAVSLLPDAPDATFMDNLAADYAAIYLTGALDVSPYESFWVSDEHLLCQEPMFDLRTLYASAGLTVPDWRQRPDDHLVYELQFLSRRLQGFAENMINSDPVTVRTEWRSLAMLLDHHLLRWLPDFAIRVTQRCDTAFFGALALLTDTWCQQLREAIALHLGEPRPSREAIEAMLRPLPSAAPRPTPVQFMPGSGRPSW
jgi:putative dimethyl sulfoxide reductase chaperone